MTLEHLDTIIAFVVIIKDLCPVTEATPFSTLTINYSSYAKQSSSLSDSTEDT
jgi:hypothetical protein